MEVALHYILFSLFSLFTLFTLFILFKQLYNALTLACIPNPIYVVREG